MKVGFTQNTRSLQKQWWNNGIIEVFSEVCPAGFAAGKLQEKEVKLPRIQKLEVQAPNNLLNFLI